MLNEDDYEDDIIKPDDEGDDEGSVSKPDWKKKKVGDDERLTLRIDALEADRWQAKSNKMQPDIKRTKTGKISKKVRQLYDDDDEYDDFDEDVERSFRELRRSQAESSNNDSTLLDALAPSERLMIEQRTQLQTIKQQENAGKLNAIEQADALARRAGLDRSQVADNTKQINEAIYNPRRLRVQSLEENVVKQTGIKGEIKPSAEAKVADGIKQVQKTTENKRVNHIKIDDVKSVSTRNMSQNETAEMILKKSGQEAKLAEIKKQSANNTFPPTNSKTKEETNMAKEFETSVEKHNNAEQSKEQKSQKSYTQQVKNLLRDSLKKGNTTR
ncbi:MAG: hypothetical protein IJ099_05615 [Alphaproteobacteria bacterium]|nr:hypothetical protein [Alphaproteobacteria bacterium]